jgi:hypothetical protein
MPHGKKKLSICDRNAIRVVGRKIGPNVLCSTGLSIQERPIRKRPFPYQ